MAAYQCPRRVDFHEFGRKRCALFVTIDDMDTSLRPLTSLRCKRFGGDATGPRLARRAPGRVPVRLMLDDFANLDVGELRRRPLPSRAAAEIDCVQSSPNRSPSWKRATASRRRTRSDRQLRPSVGPGVSGRGDGALFQLAREQTRRKFACHADRSLVAVPARACGRVRQGLPAGAASALRRPCGLRAGRSRVQTLRRCGWTTSTRSFSTSRS